MTATTATYEITKTPLAAEQYRTTIEITETTNELDIELFVFSVEGDVYVSVATRYDLETYPLTKDEAINAGLPYYRGGAVARDYPTVEGAEAFIAQTISRINYLCLSIDRVAQPFTGTSTGTVPA